MAQVACQKNIAAPSCHSALPARFFCTDIGAFAASLKAAQHWPTPVPPLYLLYQPTRRNSPTLNRLRKRYVTNCVFIQHLLVFFLLSSRHNWRIYFFMPPPHPSFFLSLSSGLSLGWNHTCASHTSRHTGETYVGWNMVRELCWISLAKRVVINRMTFGNNYQPSSPHPSFPPSFSSRAHPFLCPSPSPLSFSSSF